MMKCAGFSPHRGFYPTSSRATGVSWANAIGRSGSIVGSLLGGWMLALGWGVTTVYALVAIPALVAAAALLFLGSNERRRHAGNSYCTGVQG